MISVSWLKKRQPYWARLESLLGEVTAVLDDHGGGLEVSYLTSLCLARAG